MMGYDNEDDSLAIPLIYIYNSVGEVYYVRNGDDDIGNDN
jgi:hypothetical protein